MLGAALIGASFFFPGAGLFGTIWFIQVLLSVLLKCFTGTGIGTLVGTGLSAIGLGLVLQGIGNILYPVEDPTFEDNPQISFNFSGTQNTSKKFGTPVPIVYGEIFTGSVVISGDIDTEAVQA